MAADGATDRLSMGTKLAFGVGQTAEGIKNVAFSMFVVLYYNQVLGLDPALAGLAAGIALTFDAVTDPIAGSLSDSTHSRWGRRHPFMVISAVPLAVTFFFLFAPPAGLEGWDLFSWLLISAILVRAAMTFYHVPHLALGAELSPDYVERAKVFTYSTFFGFLGGIGMRVVAPPLFFSRNEKELLDPEAYAPFATTLGLVMMITILWCAWGTRNRIPHLPQRSHGQRFSFGQTFKGLVGLMRFASFRSLFFGMLLTTFIFGIESFMFTYMGIYFWELDAKQLGALGLPVLVGLPLSFYLVPWMTRRFDKRNAMIGCVVILVLTTNIPIICRLVGFFPENGSPALLPLLLFFRLIGGMIAPALFSIPASMFADIGDEVALADGRRVEGLIFAARSLISKATYGFGTMAGGLALKLVAFPDKATPGEVAPEVLFNLGLVEGPATSFFTLLGLLFYLGYPLTKARHDEIRAQLLARAQQPPSTAAPDKVA